MSQANIKGIKIVLDGDATPLKKAITGLNAETNSLQRELKGVETLLKLDPTNVDLLRQRQDLLGQSVDGVKNKLQTLKDAKAQIDRDMANGTNYNEEQYRNLQREIVSTEQNLRGLETRVTQTSSAWHQAGERLGSFGSKATSIGKDLSMKVTAPLVGIGLAATKVGMDFETGMSKVEAMSGATAEQMKQLEKAARDAGATTSLSATDASNALSDFALAGWSVEESMVGLMPTLRLAESANIDLGVASSLVTNSMATLGLEADELEGYLDVVAQTARSSNTDIDQMAEAYVNVGGVLRGLDVELNDSALALGMLANAGLVGSQAGNKLTSILTNLTAPAGKAKIAVEQLGLQLFDSKGKFIGLEESLLQVKDKLSGYTQEQQNMYKSMLSGKENIDGLNALINGLGDGYEELKKDISEAEGALNEISKIMQDNTKGSIAALKSALEELGIQIYKILKPAIAALLTILQKLINFFNKIPTPVKAVIIVLAGIAAAIGPVIFIIGTLASSISSIIALFGKFQAIGGMVGIMGKVSGAFTSFSTVITGTVIPAIVGMQIPFLPLIAIIGAVIAAGYLLIKNWDKIKEKVTQLSDWVKLKFFGIKKDVEDSYDGIDKAQDKHFNKKAGKEKKASQEAMQAIQDIADVEADVAGERTEIVSKGADDRIKLIEKEAKAQEKALDEQLKSAKKSSDIQIKELEKTEKAESKSLDKRLNELKKVTDARIKEYDREYNEQLKVIDRETYEKTQALQNQIDAIDNITSQEDKIREKRDHAERVSELTKKVNQAKDAQEKLAAQKELAKVQQDWARKTLLEERNLQKDSLKSQIDDVKKASDEKKELLKQEVDSRKETEKEKLSLVEEAVKEKKEIIKEELEARKEVEKEKLDILQERIEKEKEMLRESVEAKKASDKEVSESAKETMSQDTQSFTNNIETQRRSLGELTKGIHGLRKGNDDARASTDTFNTSLRATGDNATKLSESTKKSNEELKKTTTIWQDISKAVTEADKSIEKGITSMVEDAKKSIFSLFSNLKESISNSLAGIKDTIVRIVSSFPDAIINPLKSMGDGMKKAFDGISKVAEGAWELIKNVILGAVLLIADAVTLDFAKLGEDLSAIWTNIKDSLFEIIEGIKNVFLGLVEFLGSFDEIISESARIAWGNFMKVITEVVEATVRFVVDKFNGMIDFFKELPSYLYKVGSDMMESLYEGIVRFVKYILDVMKNLVKNMVNIFKNLPKNMFNVGVSIVKGLFDGIKSVMSAPIKLAQNMAKSIADAIRKTLKINSPSKVTQGFGTNVGEGLALGIKDSMREVQASASNMAKAIDFGEIETGVNLGLGKASTNASNATVQAGVNSNNSQSAIHLNIGTFIGDRAGLKQLERKLKDIRVLENRRVGASSV